MKKENKIRIVKYTARWAMDQKHNQLYCTHCGGIAPYMPFDNNEKPYQQYGTTYCPWCGATMIERKKEKVTVSVYGADHLWDRDMPECGEES